MEVNASREPFGFAMAVLVLTRRSTVNTWVVTYLSQILPPLLVIIDIFSLVVSYFSPLFDVCFARP